MWHDAIDCCPRFIFDVLLKDGHVVEAHFIMGSFETLDGQVLYPEKFRFKECRVVVPISGLPSGLKPHVPHVATVPDEDDFCEHGVIRGNCLICPPRY